MQANEKVSFKKKLEIGNVFTTNHILYKYLIAGNTIKWIDVDNS